MKVFKFGGASVKDAPSFENVARVLEHYKDEQLFIVISAMGKMTNAFEKLHKAYFGQNKWEDALGDIYNFHTAMVSALFSNTSHPVYAEMQLLFESLIEKLHIKPAQSFSFEYDRIVSFGELLSSTLLSHFLNLRGFKNTLLDARKIMITDATYREARIDWENTPGIIKKAYEDVLKSGNNIAVTQGFIGATPHGYTTTLGREGSDFTAAVLGYALKAEEVVIWKDVPGVLNADPKQFAETEKIDQMSYLDAIELAYYGATVIHPKTIKPLENENIPLRVMSFLNPKDSGTIIAGFNLLSKPIPCYIFKFNQMLISIQPRDFSFIAENNISAIFQVLSRYNIKVNLMQNSAISFSICVDYDDFKTPRLLNELGKDYKIFYNENLELVTIRHYNSETLKKVTKDKEILLEQKSRNTVQLVLKSK